MRKSLWSPDEDAKLKTYVAQHGYGNWSDVAKHAGLQRCGKSCRLRWLNYLRPDLKRGKFCADEIRLIVKLHKTLGNSWSKIASYLPGRTDNDVKNFWHSYTRSTRRVNEQLSTKFNTNVIDNGVGSNHDQLILGSSSCSHDSTSITSSTNDSSTHCDNNAMVMNPPNHYQSMMIHHENIEPLCENIIALGTNQIPHLLDVCSKEESRSSSTNVPTNHSFNQGLNYYHNLINGVNQQHTNPNYPLWDHQLVPTSSSDDGLQSVLWNFMNHQLHTSALE